MRAAGAIIAACTVLVPCTAAQAQTRGDQPTDPGAPGPDPVPGGSPPDLALTKRQVSSTGGPQPILTFNLRVRNRSAVTATRVVVADRLAPGTVLVSAQPDQGSCAQRAPRLLVCTLGDLGPGESTSIRVRVQQVNPRAGLNVAVVGAGSPEDVLANNVALARVSAVRRAAPPAACPSLPQRLLSQSTSRALTSWGRSC